MNKTRLINSLRIACPASPETTAYVVNVLAQLGHRPAFPDSPRYCQLWANVTAGKILGRGVTKWEAELSMESDRLEKIKAEYEPQRRQIEAERKATMERVKDLESALNALKSE